MRVILIRHAESVKNLEDRHGDSKYTWPLSLSGLQASRIFSTTLPTLAHIERVYCSNSAPCLQTASFIGKVYGMTPKIEPALRSIHLGIISGLSSEEVRAIYPEISIQIENYHAGGLHPKYYRIPGCEAIHRFELRVRRAYVRIIESGFDEVCVVAHRSTITMLLNIALNWPKSVEEGHYRVLSLPSLCISLINTDRQHLKPSVQAIGLSVHDPRIQKIFKGIQPNSLTNHTGHLPENNPKGYFGNSQNNSTAEF